MRIFIIICNWEKNLENVDFFKRSLKVGAMEAEKEQNPARIPYISIAILELVRFATGTAVAPGGSDPTFVAQVSRMTYVAQGKLPQIILY